MATEEMALDADGLHSALLARGSRTLSLPHWSSFAPLDEAAVSGVSMVGGEQDEFIAHKTYVLPCDFGSISTCGPGRTKQGLSDVIHKFDLSQAMATPLNEQIRQASLRMEAAADGAVGEGGELKSNWGGYQSTTTLFEGCEDDGEYQKLRGFRRVHEIASMAMEVLGAGGDGMAAHSHYPDEARRPRAGELHAAYGWLNVNRSSDLNYMHVHDPLRWSGVYFVDGGASVHGGYGGCLLFRGGRQPGGGMQPEDADASHTFLAVPPTPGTLYLFPGSVPHAVLGHVVHADPPRDAHGRSNHSVAAAAASARGVAPEPARISVAFNFSEAMAPKPKRWRPT